MEIGYSKEEALHMSNIMKAWAEGKEIEVKGGDGSWLPLSKRPNFSCLPMSYRIKHVPKYVPYKWSEIGNEIAKRGMFVRILAPSGLGPVEGFYAITYFDYTIVKISGGSTPFYTYDEALSKLCWADGTPFGVDTADKE